MDTQPATHPATCAAAGAKWVRFTTPGDLLFSVRFLPLVRSSEKEAG